MTIARELCVKGIIIMTIASFVNEGSYNIIYIIIYYSDCNYYSGTCLLWSPMG
jgi:hypothetical protein